MRPLVAHDLLTTDRQGCLTNLDDSYAEHHGVQKVAGDKHHTLNDKTHTTMLSPREGRKWVLPLFAKVLSPQTTFAVFAKLLSSL